MQQSLLGGLATLERPCLTVKHRVPKLHFIFSPWPCGETPPIFI